MNVQILIDQRQGQFTNLDVISGKVVLRVQHQTTISSVIVKLEGESRSRLLAPVRPGYRETPRPLLEVHKLLYRVQTVWPPDGVVDPRQRPNFIIQAGAFEYPFQFKLPFNNACTQINNLSTQLGFSGLSLDITRPPTRHVKATLPPSLYFPGEAEIRYYLKVTVNRPSILKENPRAWANFNFTPIEPPRDPVDGEVYARRQHQFSQDAFNGLDRKPTGLKDIFGRSSSAVDGTALSSPLTASNPAGAARFSVDARIPNPAILTCGQDIPLRILIKQLSDRSEVLTLQNLQVELVGLTRVRAFEATRDESNSWVLCSLSNMHHTIGSPGDPVNTETELSKEFWYGNKLPNTVPPSFVTCNIDRKYELLVTVGLNYGSGGKGKDQFIVLPLKIAVKVYSGIKPPADLLKRMTSAARPPAQQPQAAASGAGVASTPVHQTTDPTLPGYEEPPPSYEDAVAPDLPPIDGPRPDYRPPEAPLGESRLTDGKRRSVGS